MRGLRLHLNKYMCPSCTVAVRLFSAHFRTLLSLIMPIMRSSLCWFWSASSLLPLTSVPSPSLLAYLFGNIPCACHCWLLLPLLTFLAHIPCACHCWLLLPLLTFLVHIPCACHCWPGEEALGKKDSRPAQNAETSGSPAAADQSPLPDPRQTAGVGGAGQHPAGVVEG